MIALYFYAFYLGFALSVGVYRQWVSGKLGLINKVLFAPVLIAFTVLDIVLNYTILILFFGPPDKHDYTISARLATYREGTPGYKHSVATFVCDLLSELDTSGRHC